MDSQPRIKTGQVFIEIFLSISGPAQFKPTLFNGRLYLDIENLFHKA